MAGLLLWQGARWWRRPEGRSSQQLSVLPVVLFQGRLLIGCWFGSALQEWDGQGLLGEGERGLLGRRGTYTCLLRFGGNGHEPSMSVARGADILSEGDARNHKQLPSYRWNVSGGSKGKEENYNRARQRVKGSIGDLCWARLPDGCEVSEV